MKLVVRVTHDTCVLVNHVINETEQSFGEAQILIGGQQESGMHLFSWVVLFSCYALSTSLSWF